MHAVQGEAAMVPEDVGRKAAHTLLEEIARGGVTDGTHQVGYLALAFCLKKVFPIIFERFSALFDPVSSELSSAQHFSMMCRKFPD